jgi:purine-binding chemotaxis protein CheW
MIAKGPSFFASHVRDGYAHRIRVIDLGSVLARQIRALLEICRRSYPSGRESDMATRQCDAMPNPILQVRDMLAPQEITPIPLAPSEIAGSLNLRGRIVTSLDLRVRLGLPMGDVGQDRTSIVVEHHGDLYSLIIDTVGEVLELSSKKPERTPATLEASWSRFSNGIYRLDVGLLLVLDIDRVLDIGAAAAT